MDKRVIQRRRKIRKILASLSQEEAEKFLNSLKIKRLDNDNIVYDKKQK